MERKKLVNYFLYFVIIASLAGIFILYRGGFTGDVIQGEINGSFINLTKEIQLSEDLRKGSNMIPVKQINQEEGILNISYGFDNSGFVGDEVIVDIWLLDKNKTEVKKIQDYFAINRDGLIERSVAMDISDLEQGNYEIYFALDSDLNNPVSQEIFIENPSITGSAILNQPKGKMIGYVIFVLIIFIGIFFIIRNHRKEDFKEEL